jgi:hypothetical protein
MTPFIRKLCWSVSQGIVILCFFGTFFVFAPWIGALPMSEAPPAVAANLPANCPAYTANHGQYHCFWRGTRSQNPLGFWLCALFMLACWAFLIYTGRTERGFRLPAFREIFRLGRLPRH